MDPKNPSLSNTGTHGPVTTPPRGIPTEEEIQQRIRESRLKDGTPIMPPEDAEALNALCNTLANTIASPDYSQDLLLRHAHMLNEMFYKMMNQLTLCVPKLKPGYEGTAYAALNQQIQQKFYMLAMQVQRQCADAIRNAHAISYMQALTQSTLARTIDTLPHPPQKADQTGETEKA
jgi:hypothetical protein